MELPHCTYCKKLFGSTRELEWHILEIIITGNSNSFCILMYKSVLLEQLFQTWELLPMTTTKPN